MVDDNSEHPHSPPCHMVHLKYLHVKSMQEQVALPSKETRIGGGKRSSRSNRIGVDEKFSPWQIIPRVIRILGGGFYGYQDVHCSVVPSWRIALREKLMANNKQIRETVVKLQFISKVTGLLLFSRSATLIIYLYQERGQNNLFLGRFCGTQGCYIECTQ